MTSLRSNFVTGYDIQTELYIFKFTAIHHRWLIGSSHDAYNATISLTILPTFIRELLHIDYATVFKLYFPLLAASVAPIIYQFSNIFVEENWSFIAVIFFIVQPQFMQELPGLARQQIAFIFFFLLIMTMFV